MKKNLPSFSMLSLFCLLAACSAAKTETKKTDMESNKTAIASNKQAASDLVNYYKGTSSVSLPNGQIVGKSSLIVRRTLIPSASKIEEYVVDISPKTENGQREFKVVMTVDRDNFTLKETNGAFTGTGTLQGEPWKWTSWSSKSVLPNKMIVKSQDTLEGENLVVEKTIRTPDGKVTVTMHESYTPITKDEFENERSRILSTKTKHP